jgi:hypothetical protein
MRRHPLLLVLGLQLFGHVNTNRRLCDRLFASIANASHGICETLPNGRDYGHIRTDHDNKVKI